MRHEEVECKSKPQTSNTKQNSRQPTTWKSPSNHEDSSWTPLIRFFNHFPPLVKSSHTFSPSQPNQLNIEIPWLWSSAVRVHDTHTSTYTERVPEVNRHCRPSTTSPSPSSFIVSHVATCFLPTASFFNFILIYHPRISFFNRHSDWNLPVISSLLTRSTSIITLLLKFKSNHNFVRKNLIALSIFYFELSLIVFSMVFNLKYFFIK